MGTCQHNWYYPLNQMEPQTSLWQNTWIRLITPWLSAAVRLSVVLPKHLNLWLYHFLNYQALELRSYRQNNDKMNLRQWGEHQVLTWVHKSCWPETQAALVFSCLLSAEIVDTVIYTAMVWTRGRTAIIFRLKGGLSCHCSHNLTDWPTVILFHCHSDKAQQWN